MEIKEIKKADFLEYYYTHTYKQILEHYGLRYAELNKMISQLKAAGEIQLKGRGSKRKREFIPRLVD